MERFRAPPAICTLDASDDYEAVQTWLILHESPATQRTYRKEAERLILWTIIERAQQCARDAEYEYVNPQLAANHGPLHVDRMTRPRHASSLDATDDVRRQRGIARSTDAPPIRSLSRPPFAQWPPRTTTPMCDGRPRRRLQRHKRVRRLTLSIPSNRRAHGRNS
jgi:hypothetical protein